MVSTPMYVLAKEVLFGLARDESMHVHHWHALIVRPLLTVLIGKQVWLGISTSNRGSPLARSPALWEPTLVLDHHHSPNPSLPSANLDFHIVVAPGAPPSCCWCGVVCWRKIRRRHMVMQRELCITTEEERARSASLCRSR
jgi:hypothetical protein